MTAALQRARLRRITVTLDSGTARRGELEQAAALAARLGAELEGLFVEDLDLLRMTGFPFLREIRPTSLAAEALDRQRMERELRAEARRAERSVAEHAGRLGLSWSFRVWRGAIAEELLGAAEDADVLAVARFGALSARRRPARPGIAVLFDGSEPATRALATSAELAGDSETPLVVLLAAATEPLVRGQLAAQALAELPESVEPRMIPLDPGGPEELAQALHQSSCVALVVSRQDPILSTISLRHLLDSIGCPLLVVR